MKPLSLLLGLGVLVLGLPTITGSGEKQSLSCASDRNKTERDAIIYTTASNTDLRLTKTGTKKFADAVQPLETEVAVFVNPTNKFQVFMGIGASVTDASAEVYAK